MPSTESGMGNRSVNPTAPEARAIVTRPPMVIWLALGGALVLLLAMVARTAWVSDDAYITFRTVDNFLNGFGLTWNVNERVQSYTHPLWMLLISAAGWISRGELFFTSIIVSALCSLAAVAVMVGRLGITWMAVLAVVVLACSKAFTDYATSGLENPLTFLLLAVFLYRFTSEQQQHRLSYLFVLALIAALGMANRLDTALLFAPPLAWAAWCAVRAGHGWADRVRVVAVLAAGFIPLLLWEAFSLLYYGFPFPNTAYAKLGSGIPASELAVQGVHYLADSLRRDPLTLITMLGGGLIALWSRRPRQLAIAVGVILYVVYTVRIGGDFMSGRFFAAPLLAALFLWSRLPHRPLLTITGIGVSLMAAGLLTGSPFHPDRPYNFSKDTRWGIADERRFYSGATSLRAVFHPGKGDLPFGTTGALGDRLRNLAQQGRKQGMQHLLVRSQLMGTTPLTRPQQLPVVVVHPNIGVMGYRAGPDVMVIDPLALSDAYLARTPIRLAPGEPWRIGHVERNMTPEYVFTVTLGTNRLSNPNNAALYDDLQVVTRGPLFTQARWQAIWRLNTGYHQIAPVAHDPK